MRIHDLVNEQFDSVDDITVALAEVVSETDALVKERDDYKAESERLKGEVDSLKEKNIQLLQMIPSEPVEEKVEEKVEEEKTEEKIELEDLFEEE